MGEGRSETLPTKKDSGADSGPGARELLEGDVVLFVRLGVNLVRVGDRGRVLVTALDEVSPAGEGDELAPAVTPAPAVK